MSNVKDIDRGWKRIKQEIALMKDAYVKVGFVGNGKGNDTHKESKVTVTQIALANEFGVPDKNIPSRPFMRQALDKNEAKINERIKEYMNAIFAGRLNTRRAISLLGAEHMGDIQQTIRTGSFRPLAPATLMARRNRGARKRAEGTIRAARRKSELTEKQFQRVLRANEILSSSATPLIDTGQMIGSVQYEVNVGGSKELSK